MKRLLRRAFIFAYLLHQAAPAGIKHLSRQGFVLAWNVRERVRHSTRAPSRPEVYCVVDSLGWVQSKRVELLSRYLNQFDYRVLTSGQFAALWNAGRLRGNPIYFTSWRIPHGLAHMPEWGCAPETSDFKRFMASVTSHYSIGGGLNPEKTLVTSTDPQEEFDVAIAVLNQFKVVTANSRILYDLLSPHVDRLIYAPNGVDTEHFYPSADKQYDPQDIKIGWVGKVKPAKNYEVVEAALNRLEEQGFTAHILSFARSVNKRKRWKLLSQAEMRDFYHNIDYYLCAGWHEGTPNPALEAGACGVPVVTTRVGNMPELIQHGRNGFFVEPTVESIVETFRAIRKLEPETYEHLSNAIASEIRSNWTWTQSMRNYLTAFERLLS